MNEQRVFQVLRMPHVTEKTATVAALNNQYVFRVATDANKLEIKKAVEKLFSVKVDAVNTLLVKGKSRRFGRFVGQRSDWKKAYVTLAEGQKIDLGQPE